jgi:hypothetical protein
MPGEIIINNVSITNTKSFNRTESANNELAYNKGVLELLDSPVFVGSFIVGRKYRIAFLGSNSLTAVGANNDFVGDEFIATSTGLGQSGSSYAYRLDELITNQNFYTRYNFRNSTTYNDITEVNMPIFIGTQQVKYINPGTILKPILRYTLTATIGTSSSQALFTDTALRNLFANINDSVEQRAVVVLQGGGGGGGGGKTAALTTRDGRGGGSGGFGVYYNLRLFNDARYSFGIGAGGAGGALETGGSSGQFASISNDDGTQSPPNVAGDGGGGGFSETPTSSVGSGSPGLTSYNNASSFGGTFYVYSTNGTRTAITTGSSSVTSGAQGGDFGNNGSATTIITSYFTESLFGRLTVNDFFRTNNSIFYGNAATTSYAGGAGNEGGGGGGSRYSNGGAGSGSSAAGFTSTTNSNWGAGGGGGRSRASSNGGGTVGGNGGRAFIRVYF